MANISVDRISINVPRSRERGERLIRDIANGLANASLSRGSPDDVSSLDLNLRGAPNESDDALADRIVAELIRQLDRIA